MKAFTADSQSLAAAFGRLLTVSEVKGTIPVLAFTLLAAADGVLKLTATDLSRSMTLELPVITDEPLTACVPTKQACDLLRLSEDSVTFKQKDGPVVVTTATSRYVLPTMPADKFPAIKTVQGEGLTISGELLAQMLTAALIASDPNPHAQPWARCVEIVAKDGRLSITGMSGPRMANVTTAIEGEMSLLLPLQAVSTLSAFAADAETVTLTADANHLSARTQGRECVLQLGAAKFPEWQAVVATEWEHSIELNPETLLPALRRAQLTRDLHSPLARVEFELGREQSTLFSASSERGEGKETLTLDCPSLNGSKIRIAVAADQLLDYFKISKGLSVWQFSEQGAALRFTPKEPLPFEFQYVQGKLAI